MQSQNTYPSDFKEAIDGSVKERVAQVHNDIQIGAIHRR